MHTRSFVIAVLVAVLPLGAAAASQSYRSAAVDGRGHLRIVTTAGTTIVAPTRSGQRGFDQPHVASDGRSVGWLATYPLPGSSAPTTPIASELIVYRSGRIVRVLSTPQIFWSWHFADHDESIAACTGPTHGGASNCERSSIATGDVTARWSPKP